MQARIEALVQDGERWLSFADPARVIGADSVDGVRAALTDVERLNRDAGLHGVGFVTYEAGAAFGLSARQAVGGLPLVWFAMFEADHVRAAAPPRQGGPYELGPLAPSMDREQFGVAFERIRGHLAAGDTYQANLTFRMAGRFDGDARDLFGDLVEAQRGRYSAFIRIGDWAICSASPELFFELDGLAIRARPMKGTASRGRTVEEDEAQRDRLHDSAKQQAENVMIVDMVRNDLGRVAKVGTVEVPELFTVERYPNLWQMTSLVTAQSMASLEELFAALHPSASVTGAPKVRTTEILSEVEDFPRGVYTGAIGHVPPDGNARFSVAIRTAVVDEHARTVEFGIGSGIVWDSDASAEYDECLLKGSVLGHRPTAFELIETLRWTRVQGYFLLGRHLKRLADSAGYFGFRVNEDAVRLALDQGVANEDAPQRVRLLVGRAGEIRVEKTPLVSAPGPLKVGLALTPVDPEDVWLFHKTTRRGSFDQVVAGQSGANDSPLDDVILWNPLRQVTEATRANVVVELDGERVTPPVSCGLLAGTFREELLSRTELRERVVTLDDLRRATGLWLINAVHESRPAVLVDQQ